MSKFKLLKDFNGQKAGEEVTVHDSIDNDMIRYGYGEKAIEAAPQNKAIGKAPKNKAK